ncbi:MAG: HAD family phosphatase [Clostridia bacterium]|nr:HAD family phosphatase [Clostridia bacterium]
MGKFDGILFCTDLDGTILREDKTISKENLEAIEYFKREGGYFTFVTGRMPFYVNGICEAINPNAPFGCINGGGLYDKKKEEYIWTSEMPDGVFELIDCVAEALVEVGIQVNTFYKTYFCRDNDTMQYFREVTGLPKLTCEYKSVKEPIAKIIFGSEKNEEILAVDRVLRSHKSAGKFDFIRSERALFEILPKGINKGVVIEKLAEYLGIDKKRTIAIGDYNNDVAMLKKAGVGIAVANASPEALAAADIVTVSNEEHAIARVICDIEEGKIL